jgi:hypothetical protein
LRHLKNSICAAIAADPARDFGVITTRPNTTTSATPLQGVKFPAIGPREAGFRRYWRQSVVTSRIETALAPSHAGLTKAAI